MGIQIQNFIGFRLALVPWAIPSQLSDDANFMGFIKMLNNFGLGLAIFSHPILTIANDAIYKPKSQRDNFTKCCQ